MRLRLAGPQAVKVDGGVKGGHAHLRGGAGSDRLCGESGCLMVSDDDKAGHSWGSQKSASTQTCFAVDRSGSCNRPMSSSARTCVRSPPGSSSSTRAMEEQIAAVAPDATAGCSGESRAQGASWSGQYSFSVLTGHA